MIAIFEQLSLLTDAETQNVLARIIEGYAARNPDLPVADEKALTQIMKEIGRVTDENVTPRPDSELKKKAAAAREILVELCHNEDTRILVAGAIQNHRQVLFEPITTALVMAGVILLLETEFHINFARKDGKTEYDVSLGKKPTDKSIIQKLFAFFS